MMNAEGPDPVRVIRGAPTAEELAALVGVLLSRRTGPVPDGAPAASPWLVRSRPGAVSPAGLPTRLGPGAWRASALPR